MEEIRTAEHGAAPYAVAFGQRLHVASEEALGELSAVVTALRDDLRAARPGHSWHETVALLDLVLAAVADELGSRRPAA